ncbi:hypothetical protein VTN77DRAFT_9097 [Rasamsonia byssochlamydoides]|uniref:uncharacterized protein n=1 Tax=Rasamsonia byssochlamydoides TaxID=89139 RepID=UPI0037440865
MSTPDNLPLSSTSEETTTETSEGNGAQVGLTKLRGASPERHEIRDGPEVHGTMETDDGDQRSSTMKEPASQTGSGDVPSRHGQLDPEELRRLSISSKKPEPLHLQTHLDTPPPPPKKDEPYIDPTPQTPQAPRSPAKVAPEYTEKELPDVPKDGENGDAQEDEREGRKREEKQPEIQSIMEQFSDKTKGPKENEIMSPRLELAAQSQFPPRRSSLQPLKITTNVPRVSSSSRAQPAPSPIIRQTQSASLIETPVTPRSATSLTGPPPPEPEPDQPFDFHRFLEQLRHRTADPVAKFLRSFLNEFGKKQWLVHEQVKIISDFLAFITNKMAQCEVWRNVSDAEFDNAKEGMEKLVMNRLYSQTFSPAIPPPPTIPRSASRSKRRELERLHGPGRRGQHQEDVERDEILAQKIRIYSWVREEHLDIPPVGPHGRRFLNLAQQELLKIKGYRAPRDKVICILNCCKVIFGLLKHSKNPDTSADSFVPLLILVVLKANPEHLVSNVQYILRFRNQEKLGGEAGYYLSSLSGAIHFIETLDRTSLTVSDEEFERNVEAAVQAIAESNREAEAAAAASNSVEPNRAAVSTEVTPRNSAEGERYPQRKDGATSVEEDNTPVAGLLRTIQKPLSTIGRIFSDEPDSPQERRIQQPTGPPPVTASRPSPEGYPPPGSNVEERRPGDPSRRSATQRQTTFDAEEAAARQASAEAAEARRIQRAEHNDVVETLCGMFPNLDREVIDDVVRMKEGRVGLAVDACLALSAE